MTNAEKYLVLFGLDDDKKPRAARFKYENEGGVRKLAAIKSFKIGHAKTDEAVELALKLTDGKIFSSGKGLVPLVNPVTYEKLCKTLEIEENPTEGPTSDKPVTISVLIPDPWFNIAVGALVLCQDTSEKKKEDRGWFDCSVLGISKDGKLLTVRWANFPTMKPFTVKRNAVAILPKKAS